MNKQEHFDKLMDIHYNKLQNDLVVNKNNIRKVIKIIENMNNEEVYVFLSPIIQDLEYIIQSLNYIYTSCITRKGTSNSFFQYTKFYREIISTIKVISEKLRDTLKNNNLVCSSINPDYEALKKFMEDELQWRNDLEHDIDPFYDGEIYNILSKLTINKIVKFISIICDILAKVSGFANGNTNFNEYVIKYKVVSLENRKKIIASSKYKYMNISVMLNQLSYIAEEHRDDEEFKNIVDLGFKYMELNKAIFFTYNIKKSVQNHYIKDIVSDDYSYFTRMSMTTYYQIYDKLGMYLNKKLGLGLKYMYYKDAVDEAINKNKVTNIITKNICRLRDSDEYKELSRIRQRIIHNKNVFIDYRKNSGALSSLMTSNFAEITSIIDIILVDYFKENQIELSDNVINEIYSKTSNKKL